MSNFLTQSEERQDGQDYDDEANDIDDAVHDISFCCGGSSSALNFVACSRGCSE